jgi:hypothetical protein
MSVGDESTQGPGLERLQRWMQAVVTHPGGVGQGVASMEARRSIDVSIGNVEEILSSSATLSGAERLAIYSRSYHARLLQCFREMFPALLHALGEQLFQRFALDYLQQHPPHSYTLDHLADDFARHLVETRPDADAPPDERESWPEFIIELASLEWAFRNIYDGPGVEGRALPCAEDALAIDPELILQARPATAPCLRLFAFSHPVHTYMLAVRRDEKPQLPAPSQSFVAATRWNYRVGLHELSAPQYALLQALDGQHTVGQILKHSTHFTEREPPPIAAVRGWLCDWAARGFFASL